MSRLYDREAARFSAALTPGWPRLCSVYPGNVSSALDLIGPLKLDSFFCGRNLDFDDLRRMDKLVRFVDHGSVHVQRFI